MNFETKILKLREYLENPLDLNSILLVLDLLLVPACEYTGESGSTHKWFFDRTSLQNELFRILTPIVDSYFKKLFLSEDITQDKKSKKKNIPEEPTVLETENLRIALLFRNHENYHPKIILRGTKRKLYPHKLVVSLALKSSKLNLARVVKDDQGITETISQPQISSYFKKM